MSRVLTNENNYYDIADTIRQMKEVNTTYKPRQMAPALKDIYSNEVEGTLPLSFEANGNNLLDYRIDGNTGGVGERTKNLLQNTATTQTKNGVTFTINEDKSISCNGTATGNAFFKIGDIQLEENCIMSGCPAGGDNNSYIMRIYNNGSVFKTDSGDGVLINSEIQNGYAEIRIAAGYTCDNLTFYPMIRLAEIEDNTYEPYGYKVPVVVRGKNLFDFENPSIKSFNLEKISNGIYQANTNNVFSANRWALDTEAGVQYRILGTTNNSEITIQLSDFINGTSSPRGGQIRANGSINLTFTATGKTTLSIFSRLANQSFTATNFQIYKSSIADTSYEPYIEETTNIYLDNPIRTVEDEVEYIDYSEQKHHRVRKNLLQNTATTQTVNGVTFTVNNDKSITCNGTATGTTAITINTIFSINSTKISGCPMGGSWSSFELDLLNINTNNVDVIDTGNGAVIQNENSYRVRIRIASGYTCNNLTFYPMIRKADIEDDTYEPYIENTEVDVTLPAIPTLDGTNTLSIDTTVQPSNVYIQAPKDSIEATQIANELEEI